RSRHRPGDTAAAVPALSHPGYRRCKRDARMNLLFLTLLFPLLGFLALSFSRGRLSENFSALIGVGAAGLSALVSAGFIWQFNVAPPEGGVYTQVLWQWMSVDG